MKKRVLSTTLAAVMAATALAGGVVSAEGSTLDSVSEKGVAKLRLVTYGDMTARSEEFFKGEFHDKVLEELNIDLTVEAFPWGSADQVATMLASGEKFACYNIISAYDWPTKGYLAPIDQEMIESLCPDYLRARGNNGFECVKYNDEIYAMPFSNIPFSGQLAAFDVRNDILNKYGYEADDIHTYDEFMAMLADIHEQEPNLRILRTSGNLGTELSSLCSDQEFYVNDFSSLPTFTYTDEAVDDDKIYSYYESEAFKNLCAYTKEWVDLGYIKQDELTNPSQGITDWESGNCLVCYGSPGAYTSTSLKTVTPEAEEKLILLEGTPKLIMNDYNWAISISAADAENTDRWLTLFNWMYKNEENYKFCIYGVEGKDYEVNEDGSVKRLVDDVFVPNWFLESMEYAAYDPSISAESIEAYENWDNDARISKLSGFAFDSTPVASQLAGMTAVFNEKLRPMSMGFLDYEENIEEALSQLKNAGLDEYIAEYQKQYSEWYAANR